MDPVENNITDDNNSGRTNALMSLCCLNGQTAAIKNERDFGCIFLILLLPVYL